MTYEEAIKHCVIMAYEEAIKELEQIPSHIGADCDGYEKRAISIAIEALEKQVPKKPMLIEGLAICPFCYKHNELIEVVLEMRRKFGFHYADNGLNLKKYEHHCICGQAILWEDTE